MSDETQLRLFNSLTRAVETFRPIDPAGPVRVYSCGPTVYNYAHLGNLRAYVFTDTLRRALLWKGHDVRHVINITDVGHLTSDADAGEDKMERAAAGRDIWAIAAHYTAAFKDNLRDLNILDPSEWTVATDYVPRMIAFAQRIAPAHCYALDSGLYFDTATVPGYGALAGRRDDEAQARIDPVAGKRNPSDFAIWRKSPQGSRQMEWDSPWGWGAPGWHLECSVMSEAVLGHPFDIHTGGIDHREIHHPNEIAQNQAYCACADSGAQFWMHNNFLVDRTGKMSKSAGDFLILQTLKDKGVHPLAYRLMCLQAHYRSEMEFTWEGLAAALTRLKRLSVAAMGLHDQVIVDHDHFSIKANGLRRAFDEALSDDLGTPAALTIIEETISDKGISPSERLRLMVMMDNVLGLDLPELERVALRLRPVTAQIDEGEIAAALERRAAARNAKDWATSDQIRDELEEHGVQLMDGAGGDRMAWDWKLALP